MNAQGVVGIDRDTGKIIPISKVVMTGLKCNCDCYSCGGRLEAVLNTNRRKHFRHSNKSCNPTPETELHLLAKQIILNHDQIYVPFRGMMEYTNPLAEVKINEQVSDAMITIDGRPLYIEVVVTHGIDLIKFNRYKADNAWVMVINLEEEDRELDYHNLKEIVLDDSSNKEMLVYGEKRELNLNDISSDSGSSWIRWVLGIGAVGALFWFNHLKNKQRIRSFRRIR